MLTATIGGIQFSDSDVVWDDYDHRGMNEKGFILHDHGFALAVVFARDYLEALDVAASAGKLEAFKVPDDTPDVDYNRESVECLGRPSAFYDTESIQFVECDLPEFSFVALFRYAEWLKVYSSDYRQPDDSTLAEFQGFTFKDDDIANPDDCEFVGNYNPHSVRPFLIHNEFGTLAVVFASSLQNALDCAVDENKLDSCLIDESDYVERGVHTDEFDGAYLGNAGEPFDLTYVGAIELPNVARSLVALVNHVQAK